MTDKDEIDELDEDERLIELVGDLLSKEEGETEKEGLTDMKEMEDKKDLPVRSYDFSRDVLKDRAAEVKKTDGGDVSLLKVIPEKEPAVEPSGAEKEEEEEISPRKPVLTREEIIGVIKTVPRVGQAQAIAIVDSGFDGYDRVSGAEVEALRTVPGLGPALAEKVAERLRGKFGPVASDDTDMEKKLEAGKKPEESEPVVAEPESEAEAAVKEPDEAKDKARESDPDPSEEEDGAPEEEEAGEGADKKEAEGDEGAEGDKKEDGEGKDDKGAEEEVKPEGEKKGIWSKIKGLFGKKEGGKEVDKDGTNETDDEKAGGETAGETGQEKEQTLETAGKTAGEKVSEKEAEVAGVPEKDDDGAGELKPEAGMEAGKQIDAASDDLSSDVTEEEIGDIFGGCFIVHQGQGVLLHLIPEDIRISQRAKRGRKPGEIPFWQ